jgi:hypothetical protein
MALAGLWEHFLGRGLQVITSFSYKESVGKKSPEVCRIEQREVKRG